MQKLIAIVTPNYNRSNLLKRLYVSLENQKCKNFKWYVIDDGSKDDPTEILNELKVKSSFEIEFLRKENGGKHSCLNKAIDIVEEELFLIVDNDDELLPDATEIIQNDYHRIEDDLNLCGIGYLKINKDGGIVGKKYSSDEVVDTFINERYNRETYGDKCEVFKTKILKEYRFPEFENENFVSEATVWCDMALKYKMLFLNKGIYVCEYQPGGLSDGVQKRLFKNPNGAVACYLKLSTKPFKLKLKIKYTLAFIMYAYAAKKSIKEQYKLANSKFLYLILWLVGFCLYRNRKIKFKG